MLSKTYTDRDGRYLLIRYCHYLHGNEMMLSHSTAWKLMDTEIFETLDGYLHACFQDSFFIQHISSDEHFKGVLFHIIVLCYKVDPNMGLSVPMFIFKHFWPLLSYIQAFYQETFSRLHSSLVLRGACYVQINFVVLPFPFSWRITESGRG